MCLCQTHAPITADLVQNFVIFRDRKLPEHLSSCLECFLVLNSKAAVVDGAHRLLQEHLLLGGYDRSLRVQELLRQLSLLVVACLEICREEYIKEEREAVVDIELVFCILSVLA